MRSRVLVLVTSAQTHVAAGGRTRIVSELRYVLSETSTPILLALVPPRQWFPFGRLLRGRRVLSEDAQCHVLYWPSLPTFNRLWPRRLTSIISAAAVRVFASMLHVEGIHAHGHEAASLALRARALGFRGWVLFDAHGAGPEEYAFSAGTTDPQWQSALEREEKEILSGADQVVVVSEALHAHLARKHNLAPSEACVVPCATRASVRLDSGERARLRGEYRLQDRLVLAYSGSYRKYQMVDEMMEVFKQVKAAIPEAYLLILTGDRDRFLEAAGAAGLSANDYRILTLDHSSVLKTLPLADVGFLLRADDVVNRVASPTKFAEYCICGVPVLLTPFVGDFSAIVSRTDIGYCLPALNVSDDAVAFLRRVQRERDAFAQRCHHYARENLTWTAAGQVLRSAYGRLASAR